MLANRSYYAAQAQHLAARHRVLSIDLRGHGSSDVPVDGHSYSLDTLALGGVHPINDPIPQDNVGQHHN